MDGTTQHLAALNRQHIQASGCSVEICGPMSGHFVKPIAFCDSPETAMAIVAAIAATAPVTMQRVAYFDEGDFQWVSGIAPRDCELFAARKEN